MLIQAECRQPFCPGERQARLGLRHRRKPSQGTRSPYSIVEHQGTLYYYGIDGFIASNAGGFSVEGGIEVVDEWFKANANPSRLGTILGALDPTRPRLWWLFASQGNSSYVLDHIIGFDVQLKRFFHGPVSAHHHLQGGDLGHDAGGPRGGRARLHDGPRRNPSFPIPSTATSGRAGCRRSAASTPPTNSASSPALPMEALLRTGRMELIPGLRCYVNGWRPQTDAIAVMGRTAMAETPQQSPTF